MANFDLVNLALQTVCPSNEIVCDDKGMPSVMVKIPRMTWAELGVGTSTEPFPAFVNGDTVKDYISIGKYQATVQNERAYSLPGRDPTVYIDFDTSFNVCKAKGSAWHMITRLEWMAVALWCLKNGRQPLGNNYYGKDITETIKTAIPGGDDRVLTGTGPVTWSHNGQADGIYDMNGNVQEWTAGMRLVYGELQVLSRDGTFDNCAEDTSLSVADDSPYWYAIDGRNGNLITPNGSGTTANSIKLSWVDNHWRWTTGTTVKVESNQTATFFSTDTDSTISDAAKLKLIALGCIKPDTLTVDPGDKLMARNHKADRLPIVGGSSPFGAGCGLLTLNLNETRSALYSSIGDRLAL